MVDMLRLMTHWIWIGCLKKLKNKRKKKKTEERQVLTVIFDISLLIMQSRESKTYTKDWMSCPIRVHTEAA